MGSVTRHPLRLLGAKRDLPAVKAPRAAARLEHERAVFRDTARAAGEARAVRQRERHAPVLVGMAALPLPAQRGETVALERLQRAVELDQDAGEQPVAVGCRA